VKREVLDVVIEQELLAWQNDDLVGLHELLQAKRHEVVLEL
jgi:hypothetical protein